MKCPVKDQCLFTALELIQRGEAIKGIWGGLSAIQLKRAMANPNNIPKMRGQRSRAKEPPVFLIPLIPEELISTSVYDECYNTTEVNADPVETCHTPDAGDAPATTAPDRTGRPVEELLPLEY